MPKQPILNELDDLDDEEGYDPSEDEELDFAEESLSEEEEEEELEDGEEDFEEEDFEEED